MMPLLAWPPRYADDGLAVCPRNDLDEGKQQVALLLATVPGERPDTPTYGLSAGVGRLRTDLAGVQAAARRWIPSTSVTVGGTMPLAEGRAQYVEVTVNGV